MPYTEKRGDGEYPWRVKWPVPGKKTAGGAQAYDSASGFAEQEDAHNYGLEQEADLRRGRYRDPAKGKTLFADWAGEWMAAQNRSRRTYCNREGELLNHLLPGFGHVALEEINWWVVTVWAEKQTCARDSTRHRISLLSQILTGAVDKRLIEVNPILGRRLGGTPEKDAEKVWPTVAEAVLIAERIGQLDRMHRRPNGQMRSGVSERLAPMLRVLAYLLAFTGMRMGEALGLHRDQCGLLRRGLVDGKPWVRRVIRIEPDDGQLISHYDRQVRRHVRYLGRPKPPNGSREVDMPPFLAAMLDGHLAGWDHPYPFCDPRADFELSRDGVWLPRHGFDAALKIAADGRPARTQGHGFSALPAWEPVRPGLTPHGYRHGHQTHMVQIGTEEVLRCDRLGHEKHGIQGLYTHPSDPMRKRLVDTLEKDHASALAQIDADGLLSA